MTKLLLANNVLSIVVLVVYCSTYYNTIGGFFPNNTLQCIVIKELWQITEVLLANEFKPSQARAQQ
jgi:hypothetical protein